MLGGGIHPSGTTAFAYDERGNVLQDARSIGGQGYATAYAYDTSDNVTQITYPSGRIVNYGYDSLGRISGVTTKADALASAETVASGATYQPFGPLKGLTYGNGLVLARSFDSDGRISAHQVSYGATDTQNLAYGYDTASNITAITDTVNGGRSETFGYDQLYRLVSANGAYGYLTYGYDAVGNRTAQALAGGGGFSELYSYATDSNRLTSVVRGSATRSFGYLASGQVSQDSRDSLNNFTLGYDSAGRMSTLSNLGIQIATYQHNALGQRVLKSIPSNRAFHYDGRGKLLQEYTTPVTTAPVAHIWLGDLPLAVEQSGTLYYSHPDHRGATQRITDATQVLKWDAILTPFGETSSLPAQALTYNPRLPGQYLDGEGNTGWHQNYFRTYDPSLGRYLQSDPIGLRGGLNTYAYVGGNPIGHVDPSGRFAVVLPIICVVDPPLCALVAVATAYAVGQCAKDVYAVLNKKSDAESASSGSGQKSEGATEDERDDPKCNNPDGCKGKKDHQDKVGQLADRARSEAKEGESVLENKKVQGYDSKRRPDVQIVDKQGRTRQIYEAERNPNGARNIAREAEYNRLGIPNETIPLK